MANINIKAVIFDMDGVLIDSEPLWKIAMEESFHSVGCNLTRKDFQKTVGLRIDEVIEFWYNEPVLEKVYETKVPNTKNLQYKFFHGKAQVKVHKGDEKTHYLFTKKDMLPIKREPGMVGYSDIAPKLLLTTSPDWEAKSLWFYGVNEDFGSFD